MFSNASKKYEYAAVYNLYPPRAGYQIGGRGQLEEWVESR